VFCARSAIIIIVSNWLAVLISFAYVFAALGIAEGLRNTLKLPLEFTRKFIHVAVGMWAVGTALLFTSKWFAIITPAAFIVLNAISLKRGMFAAMDSGGRASLGTVYFPAAFAAIILIFFDWSKPVMVAALMPMTWGDAFAAIIGKAFGRRRIALPGGTRTVEGTATMFALSLLATTLALLVFGVSLERALPAAVLTALIATLAEAVSPGGLDNLTVPAVSALSLWGMLLR
jgi:dolichol kinase